MDISGAATAHSDAPLTSNQTTTHSPESNQTVESVHESNAGSTEPSSPRTVRLLFLSGAWGRISGARKVFLLFSIAIVLVQLGSIIPALVISRDQRCDKPLDVFLIVFLVRSIASLPLVITYHIRYAREQQDGQDESRIRRRWTDRLNSLLYIFGIVWFIVGNYFLFTSGGCAQTAPVLFITTLVWILLGYVLILVPIFICASVIFCLPCVLVMMRILNLGYGPGFAVGATQEEIDAIPVYQYHTQTGAVEAATRDQNTTPEGEGSSGHHSKKKRPVVLRWLRRRTKENEDPERTYKPLTITPIEDAMCSICLSEYEVNDLVCKLWCRHHFHKDCVREWLLLNSSCPLCKRDVREKDPEAS